MRNFPCCFLMALFLIIPSLSLADETNHAPAGHDTNGTNQSPFTFWRPVLKSFTWSFYMNNHAWFFNNGDLRNTDPASASTVQYTDDGLFLLSCEAGVYLSVRVMDVIRVQAEIYKPAYWGNDSAEYFNNTVNARLLNFSVNIADASGLDANLVFDCTAGRQRLSLVRAESVKNYIFDDIGDALLVNIGLRSPGLGCRAFLDFFSMNSPADSVYVLRSPRPAAVVPFFNGDVNIFRAGILPYYTIRDAASNAVFRGLDVLPFLLYSRIGAAGYGNTHSGGYELSAMGMTGNTPDYDWVLIGGMDVAFRLSCFSLMMETAYSTGIDRREPGVPDVNISGFMAHLSLSEDLGFIGLDWIGLAQEAVYSSGASADTNGDYRNYGFVSFRADRAGGFLFNGYYGTAPCAMVDTGGIGFRPFNADRRAPLAVLSLSAFIDRLDPRTGKKGCEGLSAGAEAWFYQDTSSTSFISNSSTPAYVFDQGRLGKFMGIEYDFHLSYSFFQGMLEAGARGGVFLPGEFYAVPLSLPREPYGTNWFTGMEVYTSLRI